jgi:glycosyltransferase involved in cell wall biosynthesis
VAALRVVRPIQQAGLNYISGKSGDHIDIQLVSEADVVLIQREFPLFWEEYLQILSLARAQSKAVIYELDDLLFEIPDVHPDQAIDFYTPAILPIFHALASADLVTTATPELAEHLGRFNPNIHVLPNYLDDTLWKIQSRTAKPERSTVVIGYMGSDTHLPDFESIAPLLLKIAYQFGENIRFRFWGCKPPEILQHLSQTEWLPLQIFDYPQFAEYFTRQEVDILIAPLLDSPFNRCKSAVKLLEYSTSGAPVICSRIPAYERLVNPGENGFLASTPGEWEACLVRLIEDPDLRQRMGNQLQGIVGANWLLSRHASEWMEAFLRARFLTQRGDVQDRAEMIRIYQNAASPTLMMYHRQRQQIMQLQGRLEALQNQLDEIHGSKAWAMVRGLRRLRLALFPPGSIQERWLQHLFLVQKSGLKNNSTKFR